MRGSEELSGPDLAAIRQPTTAASVGYKRLATTYFAPQQSGPVHYMDRVPAGSHLDRRVVEHPNTKPTHGVRISGRLPLATILEQKPPIRT